MDAGRRAVVETDGRERTALREKPNLSIGTTAQNEQIIRGLWNNCDFNLLQILLGTSSQTGIIASFSPHNQLKQLLTVMDNFSALEKNQRIFVYEKIQRITSAWPAQKKLDGKKAQLQGTALAYFCNFCLMSLPKQHYPQAYDFILKMMPGLGQKYCNDITFYLIKNFRKLCQKSDPSKNYNYFKELLKSSYRCTPEVRLKNLLNISKTVLFLPDNITKRAARLVLLSIRDTTPKHSQAGIEQNLTACLKYAHLHYRINPLNLTSYAKDVSPIKLIK